MTADSVDSESDALPTTGTDTDEVLIGTTLLSSYKVARVLGEGGMGRIYEAQHIRIAEKRFAIKVLRPELITSSQVRARFQREIEAIARVTHPGVLTIIDVGSTDRGWPFMVCEYLNGLDLLRYLRRFGALTDDRVVELGCRIAEALEATHAQGVIHRDVKPSNVFLLGAFEPLGPEWDRVKLIDFGLSRFVSRDDQLSKSGVVMGTPAYMSPEQARGSKTDHLTDVYGVGSVLYAAATGVPPFREETQQQTLIAVMSREPMRPRELNPELSEELEGVIQRAMSKLPEQRYPSMSALRLALSNLEQQGGGRVVGRRPGGVGVRWRFLALAGSAALLAVFGVASAVAGFLALAGNGLQLGTRERAALALGVGGAVGLGLLGLWRFQRRTWRDTSKVADWLPRLRVPVVTALVIYGLASFGVRLGEDLMAHVPASGALGRAPRIAWPGWSALLASLALMGSALAALHQGWWRMLRPPQRWGWGLTLALSAAVGSLAVARWGFLGSSADTLARFPAREAAAGGGSLTGSATSPASPAVAVPAVTAAESAATGLAAPPSAANAATPTPPATEATTPPPTELAAPAELPTPAELPAPPPEPAAPVAELAAPPPEPAAPAAEPTAVVAPSEAATPAPPPTSEVEGSPSASRAAVGTAAQNAAPASAGPDGLKASALARANDGQWSDAVQLVTQLLKVAPQRAADAELQQLLRRAASADGESSKAAMRVMGESMGSKGPDLLYELLERPELAERARFRLTRFRVRRLFSPALSVALDLRFFETCAGRLSLLPRAGDVGDQRSINVLSTLVTPAASCGRASSPCPAPCARETVPFTRTIEAIAQRLRAGQRAASAN